MRLHAPCMECFKQDGQPSEEMVAAELQDGGWFQITCSRNHTTNICLQSPKYEILFDLGALALLDGYTREAVTAFATAVERFYEYCIRVFLAARKVDDETFFGTWKLVSNQSERQLGAFYFLYLQQFQATPPIIPSKWVEFRNKAVHKGFIPSTKESEEYGAVVFGHICELWKRLQEHLPKELEQQAIKTVSETYYAASESHLRSTMSIPTIFRMATGQSPPITSFQEGLATLRSKRWLIP
jgi:hypothetical protein